MIFSASMAHLIAFWHHGFDRRMSALQLSYNHDRVRPLLDKMRTLFVHEYNADKRESGVLQNLMLLEEEQDIIVPETALDMSLLSSEESLSHGQEQGNHGLISEKRKRTSLRNGKT
jgi:hypothetical protein